MLLLILFILIYLITNFMSLKYNIHIFQLNYYMPDTQIKWSIKNWKKFLSIFLLNAFSIISIWKLNKIGLILASLFLLINLILVIEKNVKKKIAYTKKVIRFFITNYLILAILGFVFIHNSNVLTTLFLSLNAILPLYMIFISYINKPIDKIINNYYVNDAKKILNSMPNLKIIAITGSYGKTSMKNYLAKILSTKYNVLYTPGNFNTLLGITRTIRTYLKPTHEIFICEVGIDRVGQMDKIIKLINPNHCMITAIGPQHLETFKTQENIINSKLKLIDGLKDGGLAFLNLDNSYLQQVAKKDNYVGYGIEHTLKNKLKISNIQYTNKGIEFDITKDQASYTFNSKLLGEHNLINLFGAITVADFLNVPIKEIINSVKHIQSVEHRLNLIPGTEFNLIDDSYNSNPVGASNALKVLREMNGFRILITPGMVELGEKQYDYNYKFGTLATKCADYIILVNKEQTLPIYNALIDEKYPESNFLVVDTFNIALEKAKELATNGKSKYILIENDLPDNY